MNALMSWIAAPFAALGSLPRAVAGLSLAGRIALCVAVFQVLVVVLGAVVVVVGDGRQVIEAWWRPGKLAMLLVLLVLTPALVYQAARLWLERDVSRFPDILEAWQAALVELRRQGISPADVPLFLVLGAASDEQEERLLEEAPCEFFVAAAPQGAAALHVYGGPDAVFVCLANCSRLSHVARQGDRRSAAPAALPSAAPAAGAAADIRGTIMVGQTAGEDAAAAAPPAPPAAAEAVSAREMAMHTIDISSLSETKNQPLPGAAAPEPPASAADRDTMKDRFAYFCGLLRRARGGVAALNGVLAVVPGDRLLRNAVDPQALGQALGDDLTTALATTGVRAPVVALVLGLEREPGFVEFIRRMPAAQRSQRVGQKFPTGVAASYDQLGGLANRGCGHVEDLITGRLFRAGDVLSATGNDGLAMLLARLRSELSARLTTVLRRALLAPEGESSGMAPFVSGCYLAACGATDGTRAFVRGVIDRLLDCQGELDWTRQELAADETAARMARVLWIVSGAVLATVGAVLAWRQFAG